MKFFYGPVPTTSLPRSDVYGTVPRQNRTLLEKSRADLQAGLPEKPDPAFKNRF
jgi:hypothetical protein